ncbi:MAG TPA: cytoplasmic protein [Polyangia bacterium]|nr:cytoplasmic protein [Polyangia bacterium]
MTRNLSIVLLAAATSYAGSASSLPHAPDPAVTDGDKYHVLLENQQVRVLRYHDEPGAKTRLHHHPAFVIYALAPFRRQLTFPDGTTRIREFKAGEVAWMPEQSHVGENVGSTPTDALLVEVKGP